MARLKIVQGDTTPPFHTVVSDELGVVPLLGATVEFRMRPVPESGSVTPIIIAPATVVDNTAGVVEYHWQTADTAIPGVYEVELKVTFGNGASETFPSDVADRQEVVIRDAI